jgi:hypothetical protein
MAYQAQAQATNNNRLPKADAFLNVVITDAAGNEHRLRKGIPLELTNHIERSIINKALSDPSYKVTLTGIVHLVPDVSVELEDIAL